MRPIRYVVTADDESNGFTPPLPVDDNRVNGQYGLSYRDSAGDAGGGQVQQTLDNPFDPPTGGLIWSSIALSDDIAQVNQAVTAFRVNGPSTGDVITIVAQGATPAG